MFQADDEAENDEDEDEVIFTELHDVLRDDSERSRLVGRHQRSSLTSANTGQRVSIAQHLSNSQERVQQLPGWDLFEAECMTCKAGTYVSVSNKGASDLEAHINSAKHKVQLERALQVTNEIQSTGGIWRVEGGKNVFYKPKVVIAEKVISPCGVPAHVLNNCVHYGADTLDVDTENISFKIYQYLYIYTVRTENLKE